MSQSKSPAYETWNNIQEPQYSRTQKKFAGFGDNLDNGGYSGGTDDFLIGVTVDQSDINIRMGFLRKVYGILSAQLLVTLIVAALCTSKPVVLWVFQNIWCFYLSILSSLILFGCIFWKRKSHPLNIILLFAFTAVEGFLMGVSVARYDFAIIIKALVITLGVFVALSAYSLQTKRDFTGMGPYLTAGLWVLILFGFIQIFFPIHGFMQTSISFLGVFIFSLYIVYDTQMIMKKLSPDEYILGCISLYLDIINLFLYILELLSDNRD